MLSVKKISVDEFSACKSEKKMQYRKKSARAVADFTDLML